MIKFENTEVMNFEGAIRGMRNPLNSWDMSDSHGEVDYYYDSHGCYMHMENYVVGENDLDLMKRLINAGTDHRKFMRQILVSVDITAPLYWWKEFDTYKVGTTANSCSTMHKIHDKEFYEEDFSFEKIERAFDEYQGDHAIHEAFVETQHVIGALNDLRYFYLKTKDKKYWNAMIQLLPSSYNQKRTVTLNYEVLRNIAHSRENHKLDEWSIGFMEWIDSLPYANVLLRS